jgi:DNA invertase Pin-like site-specific DNA recombinase
MPEPGVTRCAIYTRRSIRRPGSMSSCEAQWFECWQYITERSELGWRPMLGERFEDDGASGGDAERPGLARLLDAVRERRVDRIVVHRLDRLTRSVLDWAEIAALLTEHGVALTIAREGVDLADDAFSRFRLNVAASFAEFERAMIGDRQRDALRARNGHGLRSGGKLPLGYVTDPRTRQLVIDANEAGVVRAIFADADAGMPPAAIAAKLNERGVADKARKQGQWNARGVSRIVKNRTYLGQRPDGTTGVHDAIVERALFDRVAEKLASRRTREPAARPGYPDADPYLLRARLVCATCGRHMTTSSRRKLRAIPENASERRVIRDRYYRCRTPGCGAAYVNADAAERLVFDVIRRPPAGTPDEARTVMQRVGALWAVATVSQKRDLVKEHFREIRWDARRGSIAIEVDPVPMAKLVAREAERAER